MKPMRFVGGSKVRRKPAFVAYIRIVAGIVQRFLEGVEDLGTHADGVGHAFRADRHDHEFLDVDRIVGVRAAIDDVHHRCRQDTGVRTADIAVKRHGGVFRRGLGERQRDAKDGVCAKAGFVVRAIEVDHQHVEHPLIGGVEAGEFIADLAIHGIDGLQDALAEVAVLVSVALFVGLIGAGGRTRRDSGAACRAIVQCHIDFDGRIAPAVEDFAGVDVNDLAHGCQAFRVLSGQNARRPLPAGRRRLKP
jgi:hypothetical protein